MGLKKRLLDAAERFVLGDPVRDQQGDDTELRDMAAGKPREDDECKKPEK